MTATEMANRLTVVGQILRTTDYDLFRLLDENRDISKSNEKKLTTSLSRKNVFGASTILVKQHTDGFYYIYEGQHRYVVLKELGQPIDFIINHNLTKDDISLMNTASEVWLLKDFLKRFVTKGTNQSYIKLKVLIDEYSSGYDGVKGDDSVRAITFSDILFIATGWTPAVTKQFKAGTLEITDTQFIEAKRRCEYLKDFMVDSVLPTNINNRKYLRGLLLLIENTEGWNVGENDTKLLLSKVVRYKAVLEYKNYGSEAMYMESLVGMYNTHQQKRFIDFTTKKGGRVKEYMVTID